jgi:ribulose-5-phosphate 4-epimerase/fuculose-1-phosphate aldolase
MSLEEVREQVATANRILAEIGLSSGVLASLGHASMRIPDAPDRFYVKGRGYELDALACMEPEDMVLCDLEGHRIEGLPGVSQCMEVQIHSCIYSLYPEVQSIVHVHPRFVVVLSVLEETIMPMCAEGHELVRRPLPVYPHAKTIVTREEGMDVANLLGDGRAVLLRGHGAVTTGRSLSESVMNMYQLEEQAKMNWYAVCAAGSNHKRIPDADMDEIRDRPPAFDLPHFKGVERRPARGPRTTTGAGSGVYDYYAKLVAGR